MVVGTRSQEGIDEVAGILAAARRRAPELNTCLEMHPGFRHVVST
jgi:hypothetical protein